MEIWGFSRRVFPSSSCRVWFVTCNWLVFIATIQRLGNLQSTAGKTPGNHSRTCSPLVGSHLRYFGRKTVTHFKYILRHSYIKYINTVWPILGGGFNPSAKYEFVSWDDELPNIWKVIKAMFQTTNQPMFHMIFPWPCQAAKTHGGEALLELDESRPRQRMSHGEAALLKTGMSHDVACILQNIAVLDGWLSRKLHFTGNYVCIYTTAFPTYLTLRRAQLLCQGQVPSECKKASPHIPRKLYFRMGLNKEKSYHQPSFPRFPNSAATNLRWAARINGSFCTGRLMQAYPLQSLIEVKARCCNVPPTSSLKQLIKSCTLIIGCSSCSSPDAVGQVVEILQAQVLHHILPNWSELGSGCGHQKVLLTKTCTQIAQAFNCNLFLN